MVTLLGLQCGKIYEDEQRTEDLPRHAKLEPLGHSFYARTALQGVEGHAGMVVVIVVMRAYPKTGDAIEFQVVITAL